MSASSGPTRRTGEGQPFQVVEFPTYGGKPVKYRQIAADLRAMIESGELPAGSMLPSEPQLTKMYEASSTTIREALAVLRTEGLILTERGRASFVRRPVENSLVYGRAVARTGGHHHDTSLDDHRAIEEPITYRIDATPELARRFGVTERMPIFGRDTLAANRIGHRILHRLYVPVSVAAQIPALEENPFRDPADLYDILAEHAGTLHFSDAVTARTPTPDDADTLKIPAGTPMLVIHRTITDAHGHVYAIEETHLAADNTELHYLRHSTTRRAARARA